MINKDEEIEDLYKHKEKQPYLVVLGAGATMAAIENGDKNGKRSAVMDGFLDKIGMETILNGITLDYKGNNLEEIYSELHNKPQYKDVVDKIEMGIIEYFSDMELPDNLTIYDYLVISLSKKDCIATFNWDPLLMQAYNRMRKITGDLPEMLFLHGNVAAGLCEKCKRYAPLQNKNCQSCSKPLVMPPLLYPVKQKDYSKDIFICDQWKCFEWYCKNAALLTFFGYSAPKSDADARERILEAYTSHNRAIDVIEIIDLKNEDEDFCESWNDFSEPVRGHITFHKTFWDSILAEYPRRAVKGYVDRVRGGGWNGSDITLEPGLDIESLKLRLKPLLNDNN